MINTIALASEYHGMDSSTATFLEVVNFVLTVAFFFEMVLKVSVLGPREYCGDAFNLFDAVIVLLSLVELAWSRPGFISGEAATGGGAISALRSFRLFRIFKLARSWPAMRKLLALLVKTMFDISYFMVLLVLIIYIFALLGMQMFANQYAFDDHGAHVSVHEHLERGVAADIPRAHFDTLLWVGRSSGFSGRELEHCHVRRYPLRRLDLIALPRALVVDVFVVLNLFLAVLLNLLRG